MKHLYGRKLLITLLLSVIISAAGAQHHYVVVGVFALEDHAKKFTGYVRSQTYNAGYEMYVAKQLFYVYALKTEDPVEAVKLAKNLQTESEFKDCWVFKGTLGNEAEVKQFITEITQPVQEKDSV